MKRNTPNTQFILAVIFILLVFSACFVMASSEGFGPRCKRLHPQDVAQYERCVELLSHGLPASFK